MWVRRRNALQRSLLAALLALAFAAAVGTASAGAWQAGGRPCASAYEAPRQLNLHELRSSILCLVNETRQHHGLAPLNFNESLRTSAERHSEDMVTEHYFGHYGPRGGGVGDRVVRAGYLNRIGSYALGENIGGGIGRSGSPVAVYEEWMHSSEHRDNILSSAFRDFGAGVARGFPAGGGAAAATYTLDFGSRR